MREWASAFSDKRITAMGLGLLGRGVGDVKFLAEQKADITVTDLKDEEALTESILLLKEFPNIVYHLNGHDLADFSNRDFVLKAGGIPLDSPYIAEARRNGIPIKMSASWFAEMAQIPLVGVTGTRGKSTVTHLLHEMMQAVGMEVLLGGNIRGVSTLALLPQVTERSIALMELDSWQCQGFGEAKISPHIGVFTTFMPDHMNYYKGDMNLYLADKAQIFLNQKPDDTIIVSTQALPIIKEEYGKHIRSHLIVADPKQFPKKWDIQIPGEHNRLNAICAIEAARALGIDEETIKKTVQDFKGVPGRLEFMREIKGVKIYNDNNATTPEATIAALRALQEVPGTEKDIILILGGADKGLTVSALVEEISHHAKKVIFLAGSGTDRMKGTDPVFNSLEAAFTAAMGAAQAGDTILFSPAFASFGMFRNEFDRGDQFRALVNAQS